MRRHEIKVDASIVVDSQLNGQPIAKEGVLPYSDGKALKRWVDLQANIGMMVPVLDEHPDPDNGNDGLYSGNEKVWGLAKIRQLGDVHRLVADMMMYDGAPIKKGYSIGFWYLHVLEKGNFDGKEYDYVQAFLTVDHVALTSYPRDPTALQLTPERAKELLGGVSTDSITVVGAQYINVAVSYDSMVLMDPRETAIRDALLRDNPTISEDELDKRAAQMRANEIELLENKQKHKKEGGDMADEKLIDENTALKAQVDTLTSELDKVKAAAEADSEKRALAAELDAIKKEKDALRAALDAKEAAEFQTKVDSMLKSMHDSHGIDMATFKGEGIDFLRGAMKACELLSPGEDTGKQLTDEELKAKADSALSSDGRRYKSTMYRMSFDKAHQTPEGMPTFRDPEGNPPDHPYPAGHTFKNWGE